MYLNISSIQIIKALKLYMIFKYNIHCIIMIKHNLYHSNENGQFHALLANRRTTNYINYKTKIQFTMK